MEPVTLATNWIATAAAVAGTDAAHDLNDAYATFRGFVGERYKEAAPFVEAVEAHPSSEAHQNSLLERLRAAGAAEDSELAEHTRRLLSAVENRGIFVEERKSRCPGNQTPVWEPVRQSDGTVVYQWVCR
jgi:hypothetical protein